MIATLLFVALQVATPTGEEPVAPYVHADANAGAAPFAGDAMWRAFHGRAGVERIVADLVARNVADPRITDIFKGQDLVRLRRTLTEQFCYILNGGCGYSGRTMRAAHADMGIQQADMAALVENLQAAMGREHVAFGAQNRLLAKLAPMHREIVKVRGVRAPATATAP
ncbi:group 1 truncated hemoglobin [Sphingomonas sp. A2-49]|uniref:group I truncated hemoglobin n=1 Tax=Sphingomonas sp. A2-49 TaxID=1391375 RepID=UPI0021D37981|nr:group 1 truncated hemoglobin [Sphingomonas sp. A2-49]MCU6453706.1 group 1 truncated hemoglobin [Sphingomonas sp. A2-49]